MPVVRPRDFSGAYAASAASPSRSCARCSRSAAAARLIRPGSFTQPFSWKCAASSSVTCRGSILTCSVVAIPRLLPVSSRRQLLERRHQLPPDEPQRVEALLVRRMPQVHLVDARGRVLVEPRRHLVERPDETRLVAAPEPVRPARGGTPERLEEGVVVADDADGRE